MRPDGRRPDQLRTLEIVTGFQKHAEGNALVKMGDTWVNCSASVEAGAVLVFDVPLPTAGSYAFEIALDGGQEVRVPLSASQVQDFKTGGTAH